MEAAAEVVETVGLPEKMSQRQLAMPHEHVSQHTHAEPVAETVELIEHDQLVAETVDLHEHVMQHTHAMPVAETVELIGHAQLVAETVDLHEHVTQRTHAMPVEGTVESDEHTLPVAETVDLYERVTQHMHAMPVAETAGLQEQETQPKHVTPVVETADVHESVAQPIHVQPAAETGDLHEHVSGSADDRVYQQAEHGSTKERMNDSKGMGAADLSKHSDCAVVHECQQVMRAKWQEQERLVELSSKLEVQKERAQQAWLACVMKYEDAEVRLSSQDRQRMLEDIEKKHLRCGKLAQRSAQVKRELEQAQVQIGEQEGLSPGAATACGLGAARCGCRGALAAAYSARDAAVCGRAGVCTPSAV